MKTQKQRIVAIDYFRGICILTVVLNHSMAFSLPFAYIAGASLLWTSAAEMFLLLSGLTLGVVRGGDITTNFWALTKKMWRRAAGIYLLNILVICLSLIMGLYLTGHGLNNDILGSLPRTSGLSLLWSIVNLSYSVGWASFLALYSIYMLFAPFALYLLNGRRWYTVPLLSSAMFVLNFADPSRFGYFSNFILWQIYFVMGLVLARFRVPIISKLYGLKAKTAKALTASIYAVAAIVLFTNILINFNISPTVARLVSLGWLPVKVQSAYIVLLEHRSLLDITLMNSRTGVFRPLVTLLFLLAAYLLYQTHKEVLLRRTGKVVNLMGANTLWIFVAQALAIPLIAAWNLPRSFIMNAALTTFLFMLMWQVARRKELISSAKIYAVELKQNYGQAKYSYLSRYEDN